MIKFDKTQRGFGIGKFKDLYGEDCTIQDSSLATQAAIWLGISNPRIMTFRPGEGWKDFPLPSDAHVFSRMHLSIPQAKELRIALDRFIATSFVTPENDSDAIIHVKTVGCLNCAKQFEPKDDEDQFCHSQCLEEYRDEKAERSDT